MYFTLVPHHNAAKNELQKAALVLLKRNSHLLIKNETAFIASIRAGITKLNEHYSRCQPLLVSITDIPTTRQILLSVSNHSCNLASLHLYGVRNAGPNAEVSA